ncbi:hypothetical protein [Pedobacter sp. NJ-S-72]
MNDKPEILSPKFEKFDIVSFISRNLAKKGDETPNEFKLLDGTRIFRSGNERYGFSEEQILAKPHFYKIIKEFYPSGYIKEKGRMFGDISPCANCVKIGIWYYFDPQGKQDKVVDEDKKIGSFGYKELLHFLQKEGFVDVNSGKNRENLYVQFVESADAKKGGKYK